MQAQSSADPFKRHKTKRPGITYRETAQGRTYFAYARGKQHKVTGGFEEACAMQDELRGKVRRNEPIRPAKLTFGQVADEWFDSKRGSWTPLVVVCYRGYLDNYLLPAFGTVRLSEIDWEQVVKFIRGLEAKGLAGNSIRNVLKPLRGSFRYAVRKGWATHNPCDQLEADERPKVTPREVSIPDAAGIARLLEAAGEYREFVEVGFYGLRKGEVLGLTWADFQGDTLTVSKQWRRDRVVAATKTVKSNRTVPLHPSTAKALTALRLRSPSSAPTDPIFCTASGRHILHSNAHRVWDGIRKAAGLDTLRYHDLRHVAASLGHAAGLTDAELAAFGGWANANLPKGTYTHVASPERADDKVREAIGAALGGHHA